MNIYKKIKIAKQVNILLFSFILLYLTACSEQATLLRKLASNKVNPTINVSYLQNLQQQNPTLFAKALAYCQANGEKVNCPSVLTTYFFSGSAVIPKLGSGSAVKIPQVQ